MSSITEARKRLSLLSSDVQTSQSQVITGTPMEVPVPKKVSEIFSFNVVILINEFVANFNHLVDLPLQTVIVVPAYVGGQLFVDVNFSILSFLNFNTIKK